MASRCAGERSERLGRARDSARSRALVHRASAGGLGQDRAADPAVFRAARHGRRAGASRRDHVHAQSAAEMRKRVLARCAPRPTSATPTVASRADVARLAHAVVGATRRARLVSCSRCRNACASTHWTRSTSRWRSSCRCSRTASLRPRNRRRRREQYGRRAPQTVAEIGADATLGRSLATLLRSLDNDSRGAREACS